MLNALFTLIQKYPIEQEQETDRIIIFIIMIVVASVISSCAISNGMNINNDNYYSNEFKSSCYLCAVSDCIHSRAAASGASLTNEEFSIPEANSGLGLVLCAAALESRFVWRMSTWVETSLRNQLRGDGL